MRFGRLIGSIALAVSLAACGKHEVSPTGPSTMGPPALPLAETLETSSYLFRFSTGDTVDSAWQQAYYEWAIAALDVRVPQRVTYNKYRNRQQMGDLTGRYETNGYAEPGTFTVHTIWPIDNHEVVHVYSALFGTAVALFNEGLAVAHQTDPMRGDFKPRWNGTELHDWARNFRRQGTLVPFDRLIATSDFRSINPDVTYPEAGSFVRFVLDTYGLDRVKQFFRTGSLLDTADSVRRQFAAVYNRSIADVERDWWAMLDRR
jgi:hypothetical protein